MYVFFSILLTLQEVCLSVKGQVESFVEDIRQKMQNITDRTVFGIDIPVMLVGMVVLSILYIRCRCYYRRHPWNKKSILVTRKLNHQDKENGGESIAFLRSQRRLELSRIYINF